MEVRWGVTCYIGCKLVDSWDFVRLGVFPGWADCNSEIIGCKSARMVWVVMVCRCVLVKSWYIWWCHIHVCCSRHVGRKLIEACCVWCIVCSWNLSFKLWNVCLSVCYRLTWYVVTGCSMLCCRLYLSSSTSSLLSFILVRFLSLGRIIVVHRCYVKFSFVAVVWLEEGIAFCWGGHGVFPFVV
jgi:hypothetical protein